MRVLVIVGMVLVLTGSAQAADKTLTPQQEKMAACSKANKGKKGDDYKQAMSACMTAGAAKPPTQQEKMAACSKANKGKKGDDYKKAMSDCLAK
jgi:hypothetical protein